MTRQTAMRRKMARQLADGNYSDAARTGWHELSDALDHAADRAHQMADKVNDEAHDRFAALQDTGRRRAKSMSADARKLAKEYRKEGRKLAHSARDEGMWRARATRDALAGRRQHRMPWVLTAAAAGIGLGIAAGYWVRRTWVARMQPELPAADDVIALDPSGAPATTTPITPPITPGTMTPGTMTPGTMTPGTSGPSPAMLAKPPTPTEPRNGMPSSRPAR